MGRGGECMNDIQKSGTPAAEKGRYDEVGPRGGVIKNGRTVEMDKDAKLPPVSKKKKWLVQRRLIPIPVLIFSTCRPSACFFAEKNSGQDRCAWR